MKLPSRFRNPAGFTIVQTLIVIFIIAILVTICVSSAYDYHIRVRGSSCANNMRNIQIAKDKWLRDYPETPQIPSIAVLETYLKLPLPACPSGGTYEDILDTTRVTSCSVNGGNSFEPKNEIPAEANSFHDLAAPR